MTFGRLSITQLTDSMSLPPCNETWLPITEITERAGLVRVRVEDGAHEYRLVFAMTPPPDGEFTIWARASIVATGKPNLIEQPGPPPNAAMPIQHELAPGHYIFRCQCDLDIAFRVDLEVREWTTVD